MASISELKAREIKDSRGQDTLEVQLSLADGATVRASVPAGKSRGSHEAVPLGVEQALRHIADTIAPALKGADPAEQANLDGRLLELDATPDKSKLGANTMGGVSTAAAGAAAASRGIPLWQHLNELAGLQPAPAPRILANLINGGLHAENGLAIQEYMVLTKAPSAKAAVETVSHIYERLELLLKQAYGDDLPRGDEGGFSPSLADNLEPLEWLVRAAEGQDVELGIDAAGSNLAQDLTATYRKMVDQYRLVYLEDPFGEEDFDAFARLLAEIGSTTAIVGDDLTTTNRERMRQAKERDSINGVIIKPNQIGTVTEAIEAVKLARQYGWQVFASHRSGETEDSFIVDFAVAVGADGIKIGAPGPQERLAKYQRLLKISSLDER